VSEVVLRCGSMEGPQPGTYNPQGAMAIMVSVMAMMMTALPTQCCGSGRISRVREKWATHLTEREQARHVADVPHVWVLLGAAVACNKRCGLTTQYKTAEVSNRSMRRTSTREFLSNNRALHASFCHCICMLTDSLTHAPCASHTHMRSSWLHAERPCSSSQHMTPKAYTSLALLQRFD
jgi:hypothetical protein